MNEFSLLTTRYVYQEEGDPEFLFFHFLSLCAFFFFLKRGVIFPWEQESMGVCLTNIV